MKTFYDAFLLGRKVKATIFDGLDADSQAEIRRRAHVVLSAVAKQNGWTDFDDTDAIFAHPPMLLDKVLTGEALDAFEDLTEWLSEKYGVKAYG